MTTKQKLFLFMAWVILATSLLDTTAIMKFSQDSGSRLAINLGFIGMFFSISSGLLASAVVTIRAFRPRPLAPELPLWLKLADYYAAFLIAWGMFVLVFSGETPEERAERWQLEQASDLVPIHIMMVFSGITYFLFMWRLFRYSERMSRQTES
ncbi:MAG: hypothetical protein QG658_525 [Patescibacteria group bacterium]|nr:hypothetical protein [Patescibacteria group bacterium]